MSHLEGLTLYLCIRNRPTFVDGTHIHNGILIHLAQLHTFSFYIGTESDINDSTLRLSNNDIQQTFTNRRNQQVACTVNYFTTSVALCQVFSLPFTFDRLERITNHFPTIIFHYVTSLMLWDKVPFKHEFFVRVARAFPLLKYLSVHNIRPSIRPFQKSHIVDNYSPLVEYLHLISLELSFGTSDYADQFLNETKTNLPRLTELKVSYEQLESVTKYFTRDGTRRNCAAVKRLIIKDPIVFSEDVYRYFPLL